MSGISISEYTNGALYLSVKGFDSYKEGLYMNGDGVLEIPPNSCYMMSAYEKKGLYPYADGFETVVRDIQGRYHLFNYNIFVLGKSIERTNYIYQDTAPLIPVKEWFALILQHNASKNHTPRYDLADPRFQVDLEYKMSYNQAFMMYRLLEIAPEEEYARFMGGNMSLVEFIQDRENLATATPARWDWAQWNRIGMPDFASYQSALIRDGVAENLSEIDIDPKTIRMMVGRLDARYAGLISINFLDPQKYIRYELDMERFSGTTDYCALRDGEIPHLFNVSQEFTVAKSNFHEGFFNEKSDAFVSYFFDECDGMKMNVCVIGANKNGCAYARLLHQVSAV